ncbi:MAG: hypothetical protein NVSMB22_17090 [Chloroflexota bacterium]
MDEGSAHRLEEEERLTCVRVGRALQAGLGIALASMLLGVLLALVTGTSRRRYVLPVDRIVQHALNADVGTFIDVGILILLVTPLLGVVVALLEFLRRREWAFARIPALLVVIIAIAGVIAMH